MASTKRCPRGLEIQTLIFPYGWTSSEAKAWARERDFRATKADRTSSSVRIRQRRPEDFDKQSFRTITVDDKHDIRAVVGCPRKRAGSRQPAAGSKRRDAARYDLSPAGRAWIRVYQEEGATGEVRASFERLSRFDQAAIRFLLTERR